eukprot:5787867-Amphidinium_carterae.1
MLLHAPQSLEDLPSNHMDPCCKVGLCKLSLLHDSCPKLQSINKTLNSKQPQRSQNKGLTSRYKRTQDGGTEYGGLGFLCRGKLQSVKTVRPALTCIIIIPSLAGTLLQLHEIHWTLIGSPTITLGSSTTCELVGHTTTGADYGRRPLELLGRTLHWGPPWARRCCKNNELNADLPRGPVSCNVRRTRSLS